MSLLKYIAFIASTVWLVFPPVSYAVIPVCQTANSDPDGDGYGWENNASCKVGQSNTAVSTGTIPECSSNSFDPDGDGYGWENNASCVVTAGGNTEIVNDIAAPVWPFCSSSLLDPDGDGFGWENGGTCVVDTSNVAPAPAPAPAPTDVRPLSESYPYRANGPYASVLKRCALVTGVTESCTLNELPFIGLVTSDPTVEDIMNRVVVTHDWMGQRFEELLNNSPRTMLRMFQSLAVIAIGSDVNPSSYSILNARLNLDPYYLWLSVAEKRTIDTGDDFRTDFGPGLRFEYFRAFVKSDGDTLSFASLTDDSVREFADIVAPAASLLYHELAHAVDFTPVWTFNGMDLSSSIYESIVGNAANWLSPRLQSALPNRSTVLEGLGGVRYRNETPTETEKNYMASHVGGLFANDGAMTFYSYSSIREDFANLVEAAMLKYQYDISVGVYFYDKPTDTDPGCRVGWGVLNRIGNPSVIPRAEWAVNRAVATGSSIDNFFANGTGAEIPHRVGEDLCRAAKARHGVPFYRRNVE